MKKNIWLYFFVGALVVHLTAISMESKTGQVVSKLWIVGSLLIYFIIATQGSTSILRRWIIAALIFSCIGDALLMFVEKDDLYFLSGLSAFLLAHIFYIVFFNKIRASESIAVRWRLLLIVVVYYGGLITFLSPYLGDMKLPVWVYGLVISIMFMLAMHMLYLTNKKAGLLMMTGALLFVISDSVLAINKFYQSFDPAGFIIMLTYGLAQLFLVLGGIRYLNSTSKR